MTPQEQQLLQGLTDRINQTVLQDKDPEAEQYLTQSLGRNPDSLYILAQTVLVQQYALDQAKKQLDAAKQQAEAPQQAPPPAKHTSFLGSLLGTNDPAPPPRQQSQPQYAPVPNYAPPPPPPYGQPQFSQPQYGQQQYAPAGYGAPQFGAPSMGSGFLGSALKTAGIVGAGALAFEGVESLMHGFGEHSGYGGGSGFGGMGGMSGGPREEVINNYYGDSPEHGHEQHGLSSDIEDRRDTSDDRASFADPNSLDSSSGNDFADSSNDDTLFGDSSSDDSGSSDDSSFDSGSDSGSDDSSF